MLSQKINYQKKQPLYISNEKKNFFSIFFLCTQISTVRSFSHHTVLNVQNHLIQNRNSILWEQNESGFIRSRLPLSVLAPEDFFLMPETNIQNFRLRINFWYNPYSHSTLELQDESAHNHPNPFVSYFISGSYTHEVFTAFTYCPQIQKFPCPSLDFRSCYNQFVINKSDGSVTHLGLTYLVPSKTELFQYPDIVYFLNTKQIHRIVFYQTNTMTLNLVMDEKSEQQKTNIYIPVNKPREVHAEREMVTYKKSTQATDLAIVLCDKSRNREDYSPPPCALHPLFKKF